MSRTHLCLNMCKAIKTVTITIILKFIVNLTSHYRHLVIGVYRKNCHMFYHYHNIKKLINLSTQIYII